MKNSSSRTENTIKNVASSLMAQSITSVLQFVCRSVFIKCLGNAYLSFDGVFSNILTMLSLAELGFGEAIIFCLYKPLAEKNTSQIKALMDFYDRVYRRVSIVIILIGVAIIPAFPYLLKDPPSVKEGIYVIYILFLINTASSYLLIYKQSILIADQKNYVVYNVKTVVSIIMMLVQIVVLYTSKNYIIYLLLTIVTTMSTNIYISIIANKRYPILRSSKKVRLDTETKKTIEINVKSLIIYKIGTMLVSGVDNIMISSLIGVSSVGLYSNYTLIINKAALVLRSIFSATTGSLGNLNATESKENKEKMGRVMLFVSAWLFGYCSIGMFLLINPFIVFLAGEKYLFDTTTVLFLVLDFLLLGMNTPMNVFRNTMGLYRYGKFCPMICAVVNLIVSLAFLRVFGLLSIVLGTFTARFAVTAWYEPLIVYRYGLDMSCKGYLKQYIIYVMTILTVGLLCYVVCLPFSNYSLFHFILKVFIVTIVTNGFFFTLFHKSAEFKQILSNLKFIIKSKQK